MRFPRGTREAGLAVITAITIALLFAALGNNATVRGLETESLDLRFRLRGVRLPGPEVTVILVDDRSLAVLGRWPFTRRHFSTALRMLHDAGTKVIVFDILFA